MYETVHMTHTSLNMGHLQKLETEMELERVVKCGNGSTIQS